jgi:lipoprotein-anchoring transpeptidase ErfK/SrfK
LSAVSGFDAHHIAAECGAISGKMPDYYAILWRALKKGDFQSVRWRESVFDQTRQMLRNELRDSRPPLSSTDIRLHTDALEAAIEAIQSELVPETAAAQVEADRRRLRGAPASDVSVAEGTAGGSRSFATLISIVAAIVVAVLAAGGYAYMASRHDTAPPPQPKIQSQNAPSPPAKAPTAPAANAPPSPATNASSQPSKVEEAKQAAAPSLKRPKAQHKAATLPDGDLAPGVDGGSTDADVPFFFRRQPVFYRTTHPVGSIIIDKQQHFLYLIQPNQVALRYGIGVGKPCAAAAGLHKVAGKKEWPEWKAPADTVDSNLAPAGVMKGGPGNPLGARIILLDDGSMSIHGTNAPRTIGSHLDSGCIRLVNDDVVDLYNRVLAGARVVVSD